MKQNDKKKIFYIKVYNNYIKGSIEISNKKQTIASDTVAGEAGQTGAGEAAERVCAGSSGGIVADVQQRIRTLIRV